MHIIKYKLERMYSVSQILRTTIKYLRCGLTGHYVSRTDEQELFDNPAGYLRTVCARCRYPLLLRRDPADRENDYYMLMEQ